MANRDSIVKGQGKGRVNMEGGSRLEEGGGKGIRKVPPGILP